MKFEFLSRLAFWKAISDLVVLIFLFGIATNMITPKFYNVMIFFLLPGIFVTILYLIKQFLKN